MVEHSLDKVSGHEHLFGKNIQQLVVDCQVSLHAKLRHLLQSSVDKLHVTPPSHVSLGEDVHQFVKRGLGFGLFGHPFKQVIMHDQRLVPLLVILIDELCGKRSILGACWAAVDTPQHLRVTIYFVYMELCTLETQCSFCLPDFVLVPKSTINVLTVNCVEFPHVSTFDSAVGC